MNHYTQITLSERTKVQYMLWQGCFVAEIALRLNRHRSTIYSEIKRNCLDSVYTAFGAQALSQHRNKREAYKLRKGTSFYLYTTH